MNKTLIPVLVMIVLLAVSVTSFSGLGDGIPGNPFQVTNCTNLQEARNDLTANYLVMNNIDCSETRDWSDGYGYGFRSIGNLTAQFTGNFNGQGYNISGLYNNRSLSYNGVFGYTSGSNISNVNLVNSWLGRSATYTGGLIGYALNTHVSNCSFSGYVRGKGGLISTAVNTTIDRSYTFVNISTTSYIGGLVGSCSGGGYVNNSFSRSNITAETNGRSGGLVAEPGCVVSDSYFAGIVTGAGCGYNSNLTCGEMFFGCAISPTNLFFNNETGDYNISNAKLYPSCHDGTGKTTTAMKNQSTFTNWDFVNTWEMCPNGYPGLVGQSSCGCYPNWVCSGYDTCLENYTQYCNNVTDLNGCGANYTGNYSEFFPQACCPPDWVCSNYSICLTNNTQSCLGLTDQHSCGENYTGNYSEFVLPCDFSGDLCYQENPDGTNSTYDDSCGLVYNGTYSVTGGLGGWLGFPGCPGHITDGSWDTWCYTDAFSAYLNLHYTKPANSTGATWVTRLGSGGQYYNVTIPSVCWDAFPDSLHLQVDADGNPPIVYLFCNKSNVSLEQLYTLNSNGFFEEGLLWEVCMPDWNCSGYGECLQNNTQECNQLTDLNECGIPYGGDYSEFPPQVCDFCTPSWECSGYSLECDGGLFACEFVTDLNNCMEEYTGDYSEFPGQPCNETTNYEQLYKADDLPKLGIDLFGSGFKYIIGSIGFIIILILFAVLIKKLSG